MSNTNQNLGRLLQQIGGVIQTQNKPRPPKTFFAHGPRTNQPTRLPEWFKRLDVKCSGNHFAPVPTNFTGFSHSANGAPVAKYRCPVCGRTHFMARNPQGQAFCLFTKGG